MKRIKARTEAHGGNDDAKRSFFRFPFTRYAFIFFCGLLPLLGADAVKLVKLHCGMMAKMPDHPDYSYTREESGVYALRGSIRASDGTPLAQSVTVWDYYVDPLALDPKFHRVSRMDVITNVAATLSLPQSQVMDAYCQTRNRFRYLCTSDDGAAHDALAGYKNNRPKAPGLIIREKLVREYPQGRMLAHTVGFVSKDPHNPAGATGLESRYEKSLKGTPGQIVGERDAVGRELREKRIRSISAKRGADIYLTIHPGIQREMEAALRDACLSNNTDKAWAVAIGVKTGAILALASLPDFDPSMYNKADKETYINRPISFNYEPGSVMKPLAACIALSEGIATPEKIYDAGKGIWFYCNRPLRDHPTGLLTVREAIAKSSNIVFAKIGLEIGPQRLWDGFRSFGFGSRTGIELPLEEGGVFNKDALLYRDKLKVTRVPIGQGICVTQLQLATAYAMVANNGMLMKPYIVGKVVEEDGTVSYEGKSEAVRQAISPRVARQVVAMMVDVTKKGGTGRRAAVKGYSVAGKTGTAQMPEGRGYSSSKYYATFVGMLPASDPEVVIAVTLANPQPKHTGGEVSAPVFRRIANETMRCLEIEPDLPDDFMEDDD